MRRKLFLCVKLKEKTRSASVTTQFYVIKLASQNNTQSKSCMCDLSTALVTETISQAGKT